MKFLRILRTENNLVTVVCTYFPLILSLVVLTNLKCRRISLELFATSQILRAKNRRQVHIFFNLTKKIHSKFWFNSCFCHFLSLQNKSRPGYITYRLTLCHILGDLWAHGTCRNMNTGRQMSGKSLCVCVEYESCYKEGDRGNKGCRAVY